MIVEARWWSGVEDCYPTDSVKVDIDEAAKTIRVTVLEGSGPGDMACIEIALLKATAVDLGPLDRGHVDDLGRGRRPADRARGGLTAPDGATRSWRAPRSAGASRLRGPGTVTCVTIGR